jgi:hypothetical protein
VSVVLTKIRLYARLTLFVALAVVIAMVVFKNRQHRVTIWFFATFESINVLWLMLCTAGASLVSWWILSTTRSVWRDMRELFRLQQVEQRDATLKKREDDIAEAEKRIDQKIKRAIDSEPNEGSSNE